MSKVFLNPNDDTEMTKAMAQARANFRYFWREMSWEMRRIIPALDLAIVKFPFSDPPGKRDPDNPAVEEMWLGSVDFDGQNVTGTLMNSPNWLKTIKEGTEYSRPLAELSDWMYVTQGRAYGAYTVNLMRSRMNSSERRSHDSAWGLEFGEPKNILVAPVDWTATPKKGLLAKLLGNRKVPEITVEQEHPMAVNMLESLKEHIEANPSFLHDTDQKGWTVLHQMSRREVPAVLPCC